MGVIPGLWHDLQFRCFRSNRDLYFVTAYHIPMCFWCVAPSLISLCWICFPLFPLSSILLFLISLEDSLLFLFIAFLSWATALILLTLPGDKLFSLFTCIFTIRQKTIFRAMVGIDSDRRLPLSKCGAYLFHTARFGQFWTKVRSMVSWLWNEHSKIESVSGKIPESAPWVYSVNPRQSPVKAA